MSKTGEDKIIAIHAGHCPDGSGGAVGAVGKIKESTEARQVLKYAIRYLKAAGVTVYNDTCEEGVSVNVCLDKIVKSANSHKNVDLVISIHFNAGAKTSSDDKTTGTETWVYSTSGDTFKNLVGSRFRKGMAELGFRDRGAKESKSLYVLKKTTAPAILLEVCFVDDPDDTALYNKIKAEAIGKLIAESVVGKPISLTTYYKTTEDLNMRTGAGVTGHPVIMEVKKGKKVEYLNSRKLVGDVYWYKCKYQNNTGWMSGRHLKKV